MYLYTQQRQPERRNNTNVRTGEDIPRQDKNAQRNSTVFERMVVSWVLAQVSHPSTSRRLKQDGLDFQ